MIGRGDPLRRALGRARAALLWERWAPALWPPLALLAAFAALALFGLWERVGDPWRAVALLTVLAAGAALAAGRRRAGRPVDAAASRRRVEADSGFAARPLEGLRDDAAIGDPQLWQAHRKRLQALAATARARRPRAALAAADRYALRFGAAAALLVAFAAAGDRAGTRLQAAFSPELAVASGAEAVIDAWLDPPAYTGAAPIFPSVSGGGDRVAVPAGSQLVVRAMGARRAPRVTLRGEGETRTLRAESVDAGVYEARAVIEADAELRAGGHAWRLRAEPDTPPSVALSGAPEATPGAALKLPVEASDDHGMTAARLDFALASDPRRTDSAPLDLFAAPPTCWRGPVEIDLSHHRWAGRQVRLRLAAEDAAGQTGYSDWIVSRLPERVFVDPLARAVVEQRGLLLNETRPYAPMPPRAAPEEPSLFGGDDYERRLGRAPRDVRRAADMLEAVTAEGERYFTDYAVYLGLSQVKRRLALARGMDEVGTLPPELWRIALRVETGDLADAEAALRAAERALMEALARGAEMSELMQLFEAYQRAVERYMQALAQQAMEEGRFAEGGAGGAMQNQDIEELLEAIRDAAELGANSDASAALQALGEMLRNLQMQIALGGGGGGDTPLDEQQQQDLEALEELGDLIGDERSVMDETVREYGDARQQAPNQGQAGPMPGQPGVSPAPPPGREPGGESEGGGAPSGALAERQSGIGQTLDELMERLGERGGGGAAGEDSGEGGGAADPGEALERAREAMRRAEDALREGAGGEALESQEDALAALREGADALARRMMERSRQAQAGAEGQAAGGSDPLGRASGLGLGGENVQIPDKADRQRAREILEEIRRRAAERGRPQEELDYYDRLLERF